MEVLNVRAVVDGEYACGDCGNPIRPGSKSGLCRVCLVAAQAGDRPERVRVLRAQGASWEEVAQTLGISVHTARKLSAKSRGHRQGLARVRRD